MFHYRVIPVLIGLSLLLLSRPILAQTSDAWQKRSEAMATWMFLEIYQARLFTQEGFDKSKLFDDTEPLKLELCYKREIGREDFIRGADAVISPNLALDLRQAVDALHQQYVDVSPGDCYSLEHTLQYGTQLKYNGQVSFEIKQPGFKSVYFGIWLGENPLSESLKTELLESL